MNEQLISLTKLFSENVFRIPDFQRGFAWSQKEIEEFWNDLLRLKKDKNHYFGVLTLEKVNKSVSQNWYNDLWMIESKSYTPYYIVDGQQRLTTSIILLSCILEMMDKRNIDSLNYTNKEKIKEKFLFEINEDTNEPSYLFCYEENNPSYAFLISKIFSQYSIVPVGDHTIYNNNLLNAKNFFLEKLKDMSKNQIEQIYTKITQHFLFNTYEISDEIDVYVSFETMNNRGKKLTQLELLKNRLIYISSLFDDAENKDDILKLRSSINTCWKNIYYYLGIDKDNTLKDDEFLDAHYRTFFAGKLFESYNQKKDSKYVFEYRPIMYSNYLLNYYFVPERIEKDELKLQDIFYYLNDFNDYVKLWSNMHNPNLSDYSDDVKELLKKINYLITMSNYDDYYEYYYRTSYEKLILYSVLKKERKNLANIRRFLKELEKLLFIRLLYPYEVFYSAKEKLHLEELFYKYNLNEYTIQEMIDKIDTYINTINNSPESKQKLISNYNKSGFYDKKVTPYLLWEYEKDLQKISKNPNSKIPEFKKYKEAMDSIEHIYPKSATCEYWKKRFNFSRKNIRYRDSIGNLLLLSQPKNDKLANRSFDEKCGNNQNNIGYKFGSYSEMEVAQEKEWGPKQILDRGIRLVQFMNRRWGTKLKRCDMKKFLGLDF